MQHNLYLLCLLTTLGGLVYLDFRYELAWFYDLRRTLWVVGFLFMVFVSWDLAGLNLGICSTNPEYVSGLYFFTPNLPLEEILALIVISYTGLLVLRALEQPRE